MSNNNLNKFVIEQLNLIKSCQSKINESINGIRNYQRIIEDINFEIDHHRWAIMTYIEMDDKYESKSL